MDVKQVLSFIKIEHTLFSLPFVLIGYILAHNEFVACLLYTSPSPRDS